MPDGPYALEFVAPSRIVLGCGTRRRVGELARTLGRRAFFVCGSQTLERQGRVLELQESLSAAGVEPVLLAAISREPRVEDVDQTVERLRVLNAGAGDLVVVLGGGSAIDLAKSAAALATNRHGESVREFLEGVGKGLALVEPPLAVLAMPTTAGTGSEATKNAVISSVDPPCKKSLRSEQMVPRIVLIDPELAMSAPPRVTAWSGMDAITQLIESYISRRATPVTQELARRGLEQAVPMLIEACRDGTSRPARECLARTALLSGMALANSGLGMAHGVASALGVHCETPHGLACAVMLPIALRANVHEAETARRLSTLAPVVCSRPDDDNRWRDLPAPERAIALVERIESLLDELAIPRRLRELGVTREMLPVLVRDSRGNSMNGNPRAITDGELLQILERAW